MKRIKAFLYIVITAAVLLLFNPIYAAVSNIEITILSSSSVKLEWDDVSGNTGFRLERKANNGGYSTVVNLGADTLYWQDYGLSEINTYTYRLLAIYGNGTSELVSKEVTVCTDVLKVPISLNLIPEGPSKIRLSWTYPGVSSYITCIERKLGGTNVWEEVYHCSAGIFTYINEGLNENSRYFYRIKAVTGSGVSSVYYPSEEGKYAYTLLKRPESLEGYAMSDHSIMIYWDDISTETGYIVQRKTGSGEFATIGQTAKNATVFTDMDLTENSIYIYRVKAISESSYSDYSDEVLVNNCFISPPKEFLAYSTGGNEIFLEWMDSLNIEGEFELWRKTGIEGEWEKHSIFPRNRRSFLDTGLEPGKDYYYKLRVIVEYRNARSAFSNTATATTINYKRPENFTYEVIAQNAVKLMWSYKANSSGFEIERSNDGVSFDRLSILPSDSRNFIDTSLDKDINYYYRIKAFNTIYNYYGYSDIIEISTVMPQAPKNLVLSDVSSGWVKLSWTDASNNENGFKIERKQDGDSFYDIAFVKNNTTSFRDISLKADTEYSYRVCAYNKAGFSSYSITRYIRTKPVLSFYDLMTDHPYYYAIDVLASIGVINGDSGGKFRPDDHVTKAEFTGMMVRAFSFKSIPAGSFMDVIYGDWYYDVVMTAVRLGIVSADREEFFYPDKQISREEAAVMIYRSMEEAGIHCRYHDIYELYKYIDKDELSDNAASACSSLFGEGIMEPSKELFINPKGYITRGEAAEIIYKALTYVME